MRATCEVHVLPGPPVELQITGDLDGDAAPGLLDAYGAAVGSASCGAGAGGAGPPVLLLDLRRVGHITSAGLATLVGLLRRAREEGRTLAATGLSPHYVEVFALTRLDRYIHVFDDLDRARDELGEVGAP